MKTYDPTNRLRIFTVLLFSAFVVVIIRLFYWQVIMGKELSQDGQRQYQRGQEIVAPRGNILSSDGSWLAARDQAYQVHATLNLIEDDKDEIADRLAEIFVEPPEDEEGNIDRNLYKELLVIEASRIKEQLNKEGVWVPIKNRVDDETKEKIEEFDFEGIGFDPVEGRVYPESSSSAHLLGFVGKDENGEDVGYFGLEGYYDLVLTGKPGFLKRESDARGIPIAIGRSQEISAQSGVDLLTHVDKAIQITLEKHLEESLNKYGAKQVTGIIMDPNDGAILAMATFPSFDPADYVSYGNELFINPAVSESFEPGSIFKVLVMAAGIDAGEVEPDTKCDICDKPYKVDKYFIKTWNNEYSKDATMTDVIVHSDNVGMVFVGNKLGIDRMYDYITKFGIGSVTGIDVQGESTPQVRPRDEWSIVDLATSSFGQGIATTPIQMVRAVGAIANGGVIMTPQVVDEIRGSGFREDIEPIEGERVISEEAAKKITAMMAEAAENGEAKWTYRKGFRVAGKTGTAQIAIKGYYDEEKTIASYIGFAPYDDPKYVMLISMKEPESSPWASETAAPLWYDISEDLFRYFGIQPK